MNGGHVNSLDECHFLSTAHGLFHDSDPFIYLLSVARIGVNANEAARNLEVESTLKLQAEGQLEGNRGVNLDEEAARLIQLQQAYQASAQLIKVADDLFQTLISSVR